jgi:integrase
MLLYGLPVSRVASLGCDDIDTNNSCVAALRGDHWSRLPPAVATVVLANAITRYCLGDRSEPLEQHRVADPRRLSRSPRHPLPWATGTLRVHLRRARSAALASLAAELPAAVLAYPLDLNINTAIAWPPTPRSRSSMLRRRAEAAGAQPEPLYRQFGLHEARRAAASYVRTITHRIDTRTSLPFERRLASWRAAGSSLLPLQRFS